MERGGGSLVEISVPQLYKVGRVELTLGRQFTAVESSGERDQRPEENREETGQEEKHNEDGEDTEGQLEQSVQCVGLTVTVVESLGQIMFPRNLEIHRSMWAVRLVGAETLRALGREVATFVIKPAVSLQALQHRLRREVPGWRGAVLGLADGTPPAPVGPAQPGIALAAHRVASSAHQDWRTSRQDETDRALQLLLNVDFDQQQPSQLSTLRLLLLSGLGF